MLRKIVVEMPRSEISGSFYSPLLEGIESLKIIQLLKYDSKGYAGVVQVKLKPALKKISSLVGITGMTKVQRTFERKRWLLLDLRRGKAKERMDASCFKPWWIRVSPFELTPDKWRITFIGGESAAKKFFKILERYGVHYRIAVATIALSKFPQ